MPLFAIFTKINFNNMVKKVASKSISSKAYVKHKSCNSCKMRVAKRKKIGQNTLFKCAMKAYRVSSK